MGGRSSRNSKSRRAVWVREFDGLLACRDLGTAPLVSAGLKKSRLRSARVSGVCSHRGRHVLRREAVERWLADPAAQTLPDRRGRELSSGGDNDIILTLMEGGWEVAYFPGLALTHLIPAGRLTADYLGRLNRGIQKSWMHGALAPRRQPLAARRALDRAAAHRQGLAGRPRLVLARRPHPLAGSLRTFRGPQPAMSPGQFLLKFYHNAARAAPGFPAQRRTLAGTSHGSRPPRDGDRRPLAAAAPFFIPASRSSCTCSPAGASGIRPRSASGLLRDRPAGRWRR